MYYILIIQFILINFVLYPNILNSQVIVDTPKTAIQSYEILKNQSYDGRSDQFTKQDIIKYNSNIDNQFIQFIGGDDYAEFVVLPVATSNHWVNNKDTLKINLVGKVNIDTNLVFQNAKNIVIIGDKFYTENFFNEVNGMNTQINSIQNILFNDFVNIKFKNFTINNLSKFIFNQDAYEQILADINFINNNDLIVNIQGSKITLLNVTFKLLDNATLDLNVFSKKDDIIIWGNKIKIYSYDNNNNANSSQANINFYSENSVPKEEFTTISMDGLESNIKTKLTISNLKLIVNDGIYLNNKNNEINIQDSNVNGKMILKGNNNHLQLNNSTFTGSIKFYNENQYALISNSGLKDFDLYYHTVNSKIDLDNACFDNQCNLHVDGINNIINITNHFAGNIEMSNHLNTIIFNKSLLHRETNIYSGLGIDTLNIINTTNTGKFNISNTIDSLNNPSSVNNATNYIYINNLINIGELSFTNNQTNYLCFIKGHKNKIDGKLIIDNGSIVNVHIQDNVTVDLSYSANTPINELVLLNNSNLIINKHTVKVNQLKQYGNNNITINLEDQLSMYIDAEKTELHSTNINVYSNNANAVLSQKNDTKRIVLLRSNNIHGFESIVLQNGLFDYKVEYEPNEIILTLKKNNTFVNLTNNYYFQQKNLFSKDNLINLSNYLDKLWENKRRLVVLDLLSGSATKSKDYIVTMNTIFPVSNSVLYKASYNNVIAFLDQFNIYNNYKLKNNIWSKVYLYNSNLSLDQQTLYLPFKGKGIVVGVNHNHKHFWNTGVFAGISINNIAKDNYGDILQKDYYINIINYNSAIYSKVNLSKNLYNVVTLVLSYNTFNVDRYVKYLTYDYSSVNKSYPKTIIYVVNNDSYYNMPIFEYKNLKYSVFPNINFKIGKINIHSYNEQQGEEALIINGRNSCIYDFKSGINAYLSTNINNANIIAQVAFNVGYNYTDFKTTQFKIKNNPIEDLVSLNDNNSSGYFKTSFDISYSHIKSLYGINVSINYYSSKLFNNLIIGIGSFIKI